MQQFCHKFLPIRVCKQYALHSLLKNFLLLKMAIILNFQILGKNTKLLLSLLCERWCNFGKISNPYGNARYWSAGHFEFLNFWPESEKLEIFCIYFIVREKVILAKVSKICWYVPLASFFFSKGNVREKSGNFISRNEWEPCLVPLWD